jgi:glyoxylase-like metal-dependent hydrolase (beta-lactamase superfamily II)
MSDQVAPGIWRIAGESHNSVAIEFKDFITVVEAPQDELRSLAVIAEIRRLIPNKPIQYVVNTHYHFDHSGGLRTYVAQGAIVVTHAGNRQFYEDVFFYPAPRTLEPDLLSMRYPWFRGNRTEVVEGVTQKYVISDGVRTLDLLPLQNIIHDGNMLVAYLPTEKILINADMYSPPPPNAQQLPRPGTNAREFLANIKRLKLDVDRHVAIHGGVGPHETLVRMVGQASN